MISSRLIRLAPIPMRGPDILEIQETLLKIGYNPGNPDGIFNSLTEQAVKFFQKSRHLTIDGIVGPDTWREIVIGTPFSPPHIIIGNNNNTSASIQIDLDDRRLYFISNQFTKTFPVAVGKPSSPTPAGQWKIIQKALNPGGPFGTRWMRLSIPWGGYGIHGTNNPSTIGTTASHGCIRMYNTDVQSLYDWVLIGTPVSIIGKTSIARTLLSGSKGPDVKQLQIYLIDLVYLTGAADSIYGPKTNAAVRHFQKDYNLKVDGITGPKTLKTIEIAHELHSNDTHP